MALVEYSDSDGSDAEPAAATSVVAPPLSNKSNDGPTRAGFKKVVNSSQPNKIRVNLPPSSNDTVPEKDQDAADDRPAKRARIGGSSTGFNSILPAPKNAGASAAAAASSSMFKGRATGLRKGISLKTGAAPAFSRQQVSEPATEEYEDTNLNEDVDTPKFSVNNETDNTTEPQETPLEMKNPIKPMAFKPLSVGKKPAKKKKPPGPNDQKDGLTPVTSITTAEAVPMTAAVPPKPKKSLFSTYESEPADMPSGPSSGDYQPLLDENLTNQSTASQVELSTDQPSEGVPTQPQDINALADSLGLTSAQKRQLFGRKGETGEIQMSHFSVSAEYSNNNAMLASEANAAPAQNPVRSIAPGKHSLQQLLNAAQSQKDALEESFAEGKRNKKAAGNKYGW